MESPNPHIVGLDIGTTKIAAIVGKRNEHGKLDILGFGKAESLGVQRGSVVNIQSTVESIKKAVQEARETSGIDIQYVNVGIAGQHIRSEQQIGRIIRKNPEEEITDDDIRQLTDNMFDLSTKPGEEIIDVIPQEYIIDGESGVKQPVGMLGSSLEARFHVIIGLTASAKNIYKCVTQAGLKVGDLILEPIASAKAVLGDDEKEAGVALVDIGGGTTDIAIFYDNVIRHTAVIPLGGEAITNDIKEGCFIIKKYAEELKIRFGSALVAENKENEVVAIPGLRGRPTKEIALKNLAGIIQARVEEIIEKVRYEIKYSGYERKLSAGIVLTGGGSLLKHIAQLAEYMTGYDVRIGYPNENLSNTEESKKVTSPLYSTGIGLIIESVDRIDQEFARRKRASDEAGNSSQNEDKQEDESKNEKKSKKQRRSLFSFMQDFFNDENELS